ncbi:MAG TPA: NADH-quinone oxidoreductase subunit NuoB [Methanomassiliicoccaceae archaeon]|jgi:ech hydrogenase subunit C|nr:NADH-quinone oxidoreductase subunit NuoB [Euryarchaeota archaeon]HOB38122.1 NADH-quinone oxidoreductase subunit NuoB [Methanomassiliicoccaceae archaeon]HOK28867.1 NADH-quinone oxidoreductase subunit NuoB [Methanomassiliicoccaceae archaeon]HOQ25358.1 NADH-quinone oxidoreductase subunit NuoB [Methanomassiliicoccaceae archaeon]HQA21188.1 NADH-quinone oxidoreductase subunit NuoB [Methanomassiliicoccaceae archaeon]
MGLLDRIGARSPWILHFDTGSCNGCDLEVWALLTPRYDVERFGGVNRANPKQADILLITGPVTKKCEDRLRNLYEQVPEPKLVMACGNCASTGAPFHNCYNVCQGVDKVIPVDVYVPGCAARPEALIDGLIKALSMWEEKARAAREVKG